MFKKSPINKDSSTCTYTSKKLILKNATELRAPKISNSPEKRNTSQTLECNSGVSSSQSEMPQLLAASLSFSDEICAALSSSSGPRCRADRGSPEKPEDGRVWGY